MMRPPNDPALDSRAEPRRLPPIQLSTPDPGKLPLLGVDDRYLPINLGHGHLGPSGSHVPQPDLLGNLHQSCYTLPPIPPNLFESGEAPMIWSPMPVVQVPYETVEWVS